jgi:hypothetical protein
MQSRRDRKNQDLLQQIADAERTLELLVAQDASVSDLPNLYSNKDSAE